MDNKLFLSSFPIVYFPFFSIYLIYHMHIQDDMGDYEPTIRTYEERLVKKKLRLTSEVPVSVCAYSNLKLNRTISVPVVEGGAKS